MDQLYHKKTYFIFTIIASTQIMFLFYSCLQFTSQNQQIKHKRQLSINDKIFLMHKDKQCWFYAGLQLFKGNCNQYENGTIQYTQDFEEIKVDQLSEINYDSSPFSNVFLSNINDQMVYNQIQRNSQFINSKRQIFSWNGGLFLKGPLYHKQITATCNGQHNYVTITVQNFIYSNGIEQRNRQNDPKKPQLHFNNTFIDSSCSSNQSNNDILYVIQYNQRDGIRVLHLNRHDMLNYCPKVIKQEQFHRYRYYYVLNHKYALFITYNQQWIALVNLQTIKLEKYYTFNKKFIQQVYFMPRYSQDAEKVYIQDLNYNIIDLGDLKQQLNKLNMRYNNRYTWEIIPFIFIICCYYTTYYNHNSKNSSENNQYQKNLQHYISMQESSSEIDEETYQRLFN